MASSSKTPIINWPIQPLSANTSTTPYQHQIKLEPKDVFDSTPADPARSALTYSSSYPPYTMNIDHHSEEFYRMPDNLDLATHPNSAIFEFDSRYDENVMNALTDEVIQEEMNAELNSKKYL